MTTSAQVLNKYKLKPDDVGVYVGRGSPWGNPHKANKPEDRENVCNQFEDYVRQLPKDKILEAVEAFASQNIICFCAPKRCHGDTWLRIVNDPKYIRNHYPDFQFNKEVKPVDIPALTDLKQLQHLNPILVETYQGTLPKLIKDAKLLGETKYHRLLKRYCSQLSMFNKVLNDGESSYSFYYHQVYFTKYVDEVSRQEDVIFTYRDLLHLHVASLLFFNTLVTAAVHRIGDTIDSAAVTVGKCDQTERDVIRDVLVKTDAVMMPGTDTSIMEFLTHYHNLL